MAWKLTSWLRLAAAHTQHQDRHSASFPTSQLPTQASPSGWWTDVSAGIGSWVERDVGKEKPHTHIIAHPLFTAWDLTFTPP